MTIASVFGVEEKALKIYEERAAILAGNIANASTPNYQARDIDFHSALQTAESSIAVSKTNGQHRALHEASSGQAIQYRIPMQVRKDGNTVDEEIERKNFIDNSLRYQAGLSFTQSRMSTLLRAIRGE